MINNKETQDLEYLTSLRIYSPHSGRSRRHEPTNTPVSGNEGLSPSADTIPYGIELPDRVIHNPAHRKTWEERYHVKRYMEMRR